jgi:hypothetical protein
VTESITQRFAKAVSECSSVAKTKTADTGKYSYTYANLDDVLATVKEALAKHGLVFVQPITMLSDGYAQVATHIIATEDDAYQEPLVFPGTPFKVMNDPQATGSAITYARRYSLTALFALATPDDDGGKAHRAVTSPNERTEAEKQVRQIVKALPDAMAREDFQTEFINHFGCTLTALPESGHGDALAWAKGWIEAHKLAGVVG